MTARRPASRRNSWLCWPLLAHSMIWCRLPVRSHPSGDVPKSIEDREVALNDGQGHLGDRLLLRIASNPQVRAVERQQFSVACDLALDVHGVKVTTCWQGLKPCDDRRMIGPQWGRTRYCAKCGRDLNLLGNFRISKIYDVGIARF